MNTKTSNPDELAHRLQLAKWCGLHSIPVPIGAAVDAFVAAMAGRHYGVEETWDAFVWFRQGWEDATKGATLETTAGVATVKFPGGVVFRTNCYTPVEIVLTTPA